MSEEKKDLTAQAPSQELTAKKSEKVQKKDKKPGLFARMGKWFRELRIEAKKVVWPTGKSVWKNTLVVIAVLLVLCVMVTILDVVFGGIRDLIAQLV
ncbi:MAG: preprotein translocase subunit SecE [Clostridia bacterium]|nr:preprotein translocase subunit SecE [Clostridia bacterium]MDD7671610.1 preprotein translocase subunit SecE [Clostridia bacterium]MDY2928992.1 preprotein translocase subunit SecE [Clostridiaceae bacterium]